MEGYYRYADEVLGSQIRLAHLHRPIDKIADPSETRLLLLAGLPVLSSGPIPG
jgi:hypothetical protein